MYKAIDNLDVEQQHYTLRHVPSKDAWDYVIDRVDYSVQIVAGFWYNQRGNPVRAKGLTNTERPTAFNYVIVDRNKDGNYQTISAPTDVYGTMPIKDVYQSLRETIEYTGKSHTLSKMYISGNGGVQQLIIEIDELLDIKMMPNKLKMQIVLDTSVDSKKGHSIRTRVIDVATGVPLELYGGTYTLSARHTRTIDDRTVDFHPYIQHMLENWDELLMPTMLGMNDCKFDRDLAITMLENIAEEAGLANKHVETIAVNSRLELQKEEETYQMSLFEMNLYLQGYVEETMKEKHDLSEKARKNIAAKVYAKLKESKKKA